MPGIDPVGGLVEGVLRGFIMNVAAFVGDAISGIFSLDSTGWDGQPTSVDLEASVAIGNVVLALALPLTIAALIWQIMRSTAAGRAQGVLRAVVGGVGMVVLTRVVFWYGPETIRGFDAVTVALLDAIDAGPGGLGATLMEGVGLTRTADGGWEAIGGGDWRPPPWMIFGAMNGNILGIPLILWILMGVATLVLTMMLAFRRWALVVMIALAPLALMFLPAERASKGVIGTWLKVFLSLLAAKPLAALILSISAKMVSSAAQMNLIMFIAAMVGLAVAAFSPWIAMRFFGFLGTEISHAYTQAAGSGATAAGAKKVSRSVASVAAVGRSIGLGRVSQAVSRGSSSRSIGTASPTPAMSSTSSARHPAPSASNGGSARTPPSARTSGPSLGSHGAPAQPSAPEALAPIRSSSRTPPVATGTTRPARQPPVVPSQPGKDPDR